MMLVLLGTQSYPFDRLIDELIELLNNGTLRECEIIVQAGDTQVDDPRFTVYDLISPSELDTLVDKASLIITHGGAGSIFAGLRKHKKVIALARSAKLNEHVDDHQFELVGALFQGGYLIGCPTLAESFDLLNDFPFKKYRSSREEIVKQIETWLDI